MDFLTTKQASLKWNITQRRITKLCEENRIKGAIKTAGVWLMPADTEKPKDARIRSGKYIKVKNKRYITITILGSEHK